MSAKNNLKANSAQNLRGRSTLVGPKLGLRTRTTEREREREGNGQSICGALSVFSNGVFQNPYLISIWFLVLSNALWFHPTWTRVMFLVSSVEKLRIWQEMFLSPRYLAAPWPWTVGPEQRLLVRNRDGPLKFWKIIRGLLKWGYCIPSHQSCFNTQSWSNDLDDLGYPFVQESPNSTKEAFQIYGRWYALAVIDGPASQKLQGDYKLLYKTSFTTCIFTYTHTYVYIYIFNSWWSPPQTS